MKTVNKNLIISVIFLLLLIKGVKNSINFNKNKIKFKNNRVNNPSFNNRKLEEPVDPEDPEPEPEPTIPDFTLGPYEDLNIYIDLFNFDDALPTNYADKRNDFINAMNKATKTLESLLKIYVSAQNPVLRQSDLKNVYVNKWNETLFTISSKYFFNFGIFFGFRNLGNKPAFSTIVSVDDYYIPRFGVVVINDNIPIASLTTSYLEMLMLHQFTHILGFHKDYQYFDDFIISKTDDNDIEHTYIISSNVIQFAINYFDCTSIEGVEITIDSIGLYDMPHWSSRILLGEYMTDFSYPEEQVISGFTLAFFEDLKYLKVKNYYTGGLMRFGKHKGCEFLEKKCIGDSDSDGNKIKFENEFYYPNNYDNSDIDKISEKPSCSSGRLSKTIYKLNEYTTSIEYQYFSDQKLGGLPSANYCPVAQYFSSTVPTIGLCSNKESIANTEVGEIYSENSFCALSSLVKNNEAPISTQVIAVCFKMHCSSSSLTIQFGENDFFVCPRSGGKINGVDFEGYLLCPDYNLICTGSQICNNIFDCFSKNSTEKTNTYNYDYEIKTTQDSSVYETEDISFGWELATDGKCPINCSQCDKNKNCINCAPHYKWLNVECVEKIANCKEYNDDESCKECKTGYIFVKSGDTISCENELDLDINQYYADTINGYYIKCSDKIDNCYSCSSENVCTKCMENYAIIDDVSSKCEDLSTNKYYKDTEDDKYKLCSIKLEGCDTCKQNGNIINCLKCQSNYALVHGETNICSLLTSLQNDYSLFTDDNKLNYYLCRDSKYHLVENCLTCQKKETCDSCQNGYVLYNSNKLCLSEKEIGDKKYYKNQADNNYYPCSTAIKGCEKCDNEEICIECITTFDLDENDKCIPTSLTMYKYYLDQSTGKYASCTKIENCDECASASECTRCKNGYELNNNNLCQEIEKENDDTKSIAICAIILSCLAIVAFIITIILIIFKKIFFKSSVQNNLDPTESQNINNEEPNEVAIHSNKRSIHNETKENNE